MKLILPLVFVVLFAATDAQDFENTAELLKRNVLIWFQTFFKDILVDQKEPKKIYIIYYNKTSDEINKINFALTNNTGNTDEVTNVPFENSDSNQTTLFNMHKENLDEQESGPKTCSEANGRYPVVNSCDGYIECQNGKVEEKQCPDGLRYNHNIKGNSNPCQYPAEVPCREGSTLQPPIPTQDCPNQYGYFKIEDRYNCSGFRICEKGIGYDYECPRGLAFNSVTYRCDWPDRVPECNVEAFLGYRCPQVNKLDASRAFRSTTDCKIYYVCTNGLPRRFECDDYFGFDELTQACVPAYALNECTREQQSIADRLVRKATNGTYVILDYDDEYYSANRKISLSFKPRIKPRPIVIKKTLT